jgi:hypothetical protein
MISSCDAFQFSYLYSSSTGVYKGINDFLAFKYMCCKINVLEMATEAGKSCHLYIQYLHHFYQFWSKCMILSKEKRKLHNTELYDLLSSACIVTVMERRRWAGHIS